ncbi:hypothetical protein [Candidatus Tisiphia endosymbiont of Dascillus cervinus]|uniref:hypothetical protein n=1 Tax=Candidatus Tisiphia endosymbiont of Dascillus cervinus TaxID=3066253 RepID=UPI00312CA9E5
MLSIGGAATGCVIIGFVGIAACKAYKSFGSKNKNVDYPIVFPIEVCESSDSKNKNVDYPIVFPIEVCESSDSKNKNVDYPIVFPIEVCESSDSKNENIDCSVDTNLSIITIPLEEIQDISLAGNTTTQVEQ